MSRKLTLILSSVVLLVSLTVIWLHVRPVTAKIDRTPLIEAATGAGMVLAEETLKAVHDQGRIVLVTDYDHTQNTRSRDYRWEAFQNELKKHAAVTIAATEIVGFDPSEPMISGCPSAAFQSILEHHADAAAIVFFIDLPAENKVAVLMNRPQASSIIAVDNGGAPTKARYENYFSGGTLSVLIGVRSELSPPPSTQPQTPRDWFDQYYQVYTPQNFGALLE